MLGKRKRAKTATDGSERRRFSNSRSPPNRPKTLRNWSDDSTMQAIEAVWSEEMGANRAARAFGVPASTLKDQLSGRVKHGTNPGPIPYLSSEENELATFLIERSKSVMARLREKYCWSSKRHEPLACPPVIYAYIFIHMQYSCYWCSNVAIFVRME